MKTRLDDNKCIAEDRVTPSPTTDWIDKIVANLTHTMVPLDEFSYEKE